MKRVTLAMVAVAVVLAGAGIAGFLAHRHRPIRIGAILPLTGRDAAVGLGMRNAVRLAVDEVNRHGGIQGRQVEVMMLDDGSAVARAEAAGKQLAADPRVLGVVAHYDADCSVATQLTFREARLPNILAGVSNRDVPDLRSPVEFRIIPLGEAQMKQAAIFAWQILGARKLTFIRDDTNFGLWMVNEFRAGLTPLVGHIVTGEVIVPAAQASFDGIVDQIEREGTEYVFFAGQPRQAALLLVQLRKRGVTATFQSATHFPSPELIDVAQKDAEGAIAVFHGLPPEDSTGGRAFLAAYGEARFSDPAGPYGIFAYASTQALLQAMNRSFLTRPSVAGALTNEKLDTALGSIRFNYFASSYNTIAIYKVVEGRWTPIYATNGAGKLEPYSKR